METIYQRVGVLAHPLRPQTFPVAAQIAEYLESQNIDHWIYTRWEESDVAERIQKAQQTAGGRNFRTGGGKVTAMEGAPPPQRVAITEWDSLEKAQAFFKSKTWDDLGPDRDKALKTIRRYGVEELN